MEEEDVTIKILNYRRTRTLDVQKCKSGLEQDEC